VQVPYRGREGYLFKRDFGRFYLEQFPRLRVLDYGFLWQPLDSSDNSNWWLFATR
jgi:spore coat polysaccharide biosynthesis protein SpsF